MADAQIRPTNCGQKSEKPSGRSIPITMYTKGETVIRRWETVAPQVGCMTAETTSF